MGNNVHLVIPDSHAKPGQNMRRFTWAGKLALDLRPDYIIHLGDFADMESLSSYDKGRRSFEGRRYKADCQASHKALAAFNAPIDEYNAMRARNRKAQWHPTKIMCGGNHDEGRIERVTQTHPELHGTIGIEDLGYEDYGWHYVPYRDYINLDGIVYSHHQPSGVMGRPIGGEHPAATLIRKRLVSCTVGHSHVRDFAERTGADGRKLHGLVAGCFMEHDEDYAKEANRIWWRGLVVKHDVRDGEYEPQFINMNMLKEIYG